MVKINIRLNVYINKSTVYNLSEVAKILNVSERALLYAVKRGLLKHIEVKSPHYGGTQLLGKDVIEYMIKYSKNNYIDKIEIL